jgi:hypothetical protein
MKRTLKIFLLAAAAAIALSASALAAGYGLGVFGNVRTMDSNTFRDVDSLAWYFGGVCHAYDKGLMTGTGPKTFSPKSTVTWSQAITIAAVIHSRYNGVTLDTTVPAGGTWYSPYYNYAKSAGLLPSNCPSGAAVNTAYINRESIAYLLSRTIDKSELPAISDLAIPDISSVGAEFQSAVKLLYAAGVITGMDNHYFRGKNFVTRAQMATIITTLVMPSQRVSHDYRENADMADYEGSLENDSVMAKVGSYYYCAFKYYTRKSDGTAGNQVYALYQADGNDNCQELYTCPDGAKLSDVSSYKSKVYFSVTYPGSNRGVLMCYDPATKATSQIFTKYAVKSYCWYDNQLYVLAFTNYGYDATGKKDYIENDRYTFGMVSGGSFVQLAGPYTYYQVMDFQPYGYLGRIYYKLSSYSGPTNLYSYDLSTDTVAKMSDVNINASYFVGHVMYYVAYGLDGGYDTNLYALSLAMPASVDTLGAFPTASAQSNRTLYGRGGYSYCLTGDVGRLYRMDKSGTTRSVINAVGEYNSVTFCADKIVLVPNTFITSNPNEMKVYNLSSYSARTLYGDFIGCSCWYKGARFVADDGVSVYSSATTVSTVKNIEIQVTETYYAGNDIIVRAKYINNSGKKISALRFQYLNIYVGGKLAASTVNDFVSMPLVINDIQTFTFVVGRPDQTADCDFARGAVRISITPTYEYAGQTYTVTPTASAAANGGTYTMTLNGVAVKTALSSAAFQAASGDTVGIVPTPEAGYTLGAVTVTKNSSGAAVAVTKGTSNYTFTMPAEPVTVKVTFKR